MIGKHPVPGTKAGFVIKGMAWMLALLLLAAAVYAEDFQTLSQPVSIAIPDGMQGQMLSEPVSVAIPAGMYGEMLSKPVCVAIPAGLDETFSWPVSVGFQAGNLVDPALVGFWHMDGDWGDASGNGNHGTAFNGATFSTNRMAGFKAGSFDGADDYAIVNTPGDMPTTQFTVFGWIYPEQAVVSGIVDFSNENDGVWEIWYEADQSIRYRHNWSRDVTDEELQVPAGSVPLGTWTFFALVFTDKEAKLYLNGQQVAVTTFDNNPLALSSAWLEFGVNRPGEDEYFQGQLDEIAVYKRALTAEEVFHRYNQTILESQPPAKPVIEPLPQIVAITPLTIAGSKEAGTSLWLNGVKQDASVDATAWQVSLELEYGTNTFSIAVRNADGIESDIAFATIVYDNIAPVVSATSPVADAVLNDNATAVSFTLVDEHASVDTEASVAGATVVDNEGQAVAGSWNTAVANRMTFTPASAWADGSYTVSIQPTDSVGNAGQASLAFSVDTVAPGAPTIDAVPEVVAAHCILTGTMPADAQRVEVSAGSGAAVVSYPEAGRWRAALNGLVQGEVPVQVTALDTAGNSSAPAIVALTVDTTAPTAPVVAVAEPLTRVGEATIAVTKDSQSYLQVDGSRVEESFGLEQFEVTVSLTAEGENSFRLALEDAAGNPSEEVTVVIVRDTTAPTLAEALPAHGSVVGQADSVTVSLADTHAEVALEESLAGAAVADHDGAAVSGSWAVTETGLVFTPDGALGDGQYTVTLHPADTLGNTGTVVLRFTVDEGAPTVTALTMTPDSPHKAETVSFAFDFSEDMDATVDPLILLTNGEDSYQLSKSQDLAVQVSEDFAHGNGTAPDTVFWTGFDANAVTLDNGRLRVRGSSHKEIATNFLLKGDFEVEVDFDVAGAPEIDSWNCSLVALFPSTEQNDYVNVNRRYDNGHRCNFNTRLAMVHGNNQDYAATEQTGRLKLRRVGTTLHGYVLVGEDWIEFGAYDYGSAPDAVIKLWHGKWNDQPDSTVWFDNLSVVADEILWAGGTPSSRAWSDSNTWSGSYTFTDQMPDGPYTVTVSDARDLAGNLMAAQQAGGFVLDTTAPAAPTVAAVTTPTNLASQLLSGTKETGTGVVIGDIERVAPDDQTAWSCAYPLGEGVNHLAIAAVDAAGNASAAVETAITLDTTPPLFTVDQYDPDSASATQTVSGRKEPGCIVTLDGATIITETDLEEIWSHEVTLTEGFANTLNFAATDALGNRTTRAITITYDAAAPAALGAGVLQANGAGSGATVTLSWPTYVEPLDLAYYRIYVGESDFTDLSGLASVGTAERGTKSFTVPGLTEGTTYYFAVAAVDAIGNAETTVHTVAGVPVDTLPPENVTALKAVAAFSETDGHSLTLNWAASADSRGDLAGQKVYVDAGSGYDAGTDLASDAVSHVLSGLNGNTVYKLRVTTLDNGGRESSGTVVSGATALTNPTGLKAVPGKNQVALSWQAVASPHVNYYLIYRVAGEQPLTSVAGLTPIDARSTTSLTDQGLDNGTTYQYAVTVLNTSGAENTLVQSAGATPRADAVAPTIGSFSLTDSQVIANPLTIEAAALDDESGIAKLELHLDGALVQSTQAAELNWYWNTLDTTDGNHVFKVVAVDGSGNSAEAARTVIVSQAPPNTPQITGHSIDGATGTVTLSGTAPLQTTVTLKTGDLVSGTVQTDTAGHFVFSGLPLVEGDNPFAVKASHRGGDSPYSSTYVVSLDTGAPSAPAELIAEVLAGGKLQFSWQSGIGEAPAGYNLYRSGAPFTAITDAGVSKVNESEILYGFKRITPDDDNTYYYGVTALDGSSNESALSNIETVASDRVAPAVASVTFAVNDGQPESSPTTGPATVSVALEVDEALAETPFFSLEPPSGSPVVVSMSAVDDLHYRGSFRVDATTPHGATTWKFSGKDAVGNRGGDQGAGPVLDTQGPQATITAPVDLQQSVADVSVAVSFDEAPVAAPELTFTDAEGTVVPVTGLVRDGDALHYLGRVDLSGLAEGQGSFQLVSAEDAFGNQSTSIANGKRLTLYADTPPAPPVPAAPTVQSQSGGKIALLWKVVNGAASYNLYRRAEGGSDWQLLLNQTATAHTDLPDADGTYAYAVASVGALDSESALSTPVNVLSDRTAPAAPTALSLAIDGNGVRAVWTAPADGDVAAYNLYRAAEAITDIGGLSPAATSSVAAATDSHARTDQRHYAVTAVDAVGNESAPSGDVSIDFPVAPVQSLSLTVSDGGRPALAWQSAAQNLAGYIIYRNGEAINSTPTTQTSYTDGYYTGGAVTYGIEVVDTYGNHSPMRRVTLPQLSIGVPDGTSLRRGLLETIPIAVNSETDLSLAEITVKLGGNAASTLAGPFAVTGGTPLTVEKVAATAADAGSTVSVLATATIKPAAGTTVTIAQTSQATVGGASTALEIFNEPLVRGTEAQVRLKINNLGSARSEVITSQNGGPSSEVTVYLKDQDGNVLASGRLDQRTGSQVVNGSGYATARIEPGQSFLSEPVTFTVPQSAPYKVVLEAVIANTWYHYNRADQVAAPGMSQSVAATIAEVSYYATAEVAQELYRQGEPVVIRGQALATADGAPLPNVPVRVGISVKGFDRFYTVATDDSGAFSYSFNPAGNEAGSYSVWAVHPDLSDRTVQDRFDIIAIALDPALFNLTLAKGGAYDVPFKLINLGGADLDDLTLTVNASSGLSAAIVNPGSTTLGGEETRPLTLRVTAENDAPDNGYVSVDIATAEGLRKQLNVNVDLVETIPIIKVSPSYIDTGLMRGTQQIKTLTLTNKGMATLRNARIEGPSTAWMVLTVDPALGSLAVGQSTAIGILFRPGATLAPGVYDDRIVIYSDNHIPYTINLQATVTSSAVGNVQFDVLNELYEDVGGASITLQHQALPELIYSLKTAADGTVTKFDIPEGRYAYHVSAPGHKSYSGSFVVAAGLTVTVPVALEVTLVEIEWSVTETTIEDQYEITVSQTFETDVPTVVLVVDPPVTNLPRMEVGEVYNGEFTITNYGLVGADYKGIIFRGDMEGFEMEILGNLPATLGAKEQIVVPYRIKRISDEE